MSDIELRKVAAEEFSKAISVMACALVDNADKISVRCTIGEQTTVIHLSCAKEDLGKVIGKEGRNINALREILKNISAKRGMRCVLELEE